MNRSIKYIIIGVLAYHITNTIFPEKNSRIKKKPESFPRGGDLPIRSIWKKILTDRSIKEGLVAVFGAAMVESFTKEIQDLLVYSTYSNLINTNSTEVAEVSILVDIASKFNIPTEVETIRRLIVRSYTKKLFLCLCENMVKISHFNLKTSFFNLLIYDL